MDTRLIAWGRAVKRGSLPPLWFFTDAARLPNPLPVVAQLPKGLCGVVFRHDAAPNRAALARQLKALCRARRLALVVAGDAPLAAALHAGLHLRGGRRPGPRKLPRLVTSSAHNATELRRARRAGAALVFISPAFPTASHPGGKALGALGWRRLAARAGGGKLCALGGVAGGNIRRLGRACAGAGAIEAFCPADIRS